MSNYNQGSGSTVNIDLDEFEYQQRSGSTVDIELNIQTFQGISGIVEVDGTLQENARVYVTDGTQLWSTTTNNEGEYELELDSGTYHVTAEHNGQIEFSRPFVGVE